MKKKILLSNDDGIYAPGIQALYDAVKDLGDVTVVAPAGEQSAVGHAITLSDPIKAKQIQRNGSCFGYAVGGTPADCVKLAVCALLPEPPDLVLSGINLGPNTGISVIYSGTVSAATEGTILGIPSVAISLSSYQKPQWDTAARVARQVTKHVLRAGLPPDTLLNVNVPSLPAKKIKGYRVTRMGRSRFVEKFDRRTDPQGNVYYWMDGDLELLGDVDDTDIVAVREGYISLTPIWFDLTHREALSTFRAWQLPWSTR
jgi:5'-nucleotidase